MTPLSRAIQIAVQAHDGQTDKAGEPYILHPLRVMLAMETEDERIVAVLHDVIEDGGNDVDDFEIEFGSLIGEALWAITRGPVFLARFMNPIPSISTAFLATPLPPASR